VKIFTEDNLNALSTQIVSNIPAKRSKWVLSVTVNLELWRHIHGSTGWNHDCPKLCGWPM